jgi:hypothetical protein
MARAPVGWVAIVKDLIRRAAAKCFMRPMLVVPSGYEFSCSRAVRREGGMTTKRRRLSFSVRMRRSTTAMLPCWPSAP